jgi:hypothetical protein
MRTDRRPTVRGRRGWRIPAVLVVLAAAFLAVAVSPASGLGPVEAPLYPPPPKSETVVPGTSIGGAKLDSLQTKAAQSWGFQIAPKSPEWPECGRYACSPYCTRVSCAAGLSHGVVESFHDDRHRVEMIKFVAPYMGVITPFAKRWHTPNGVKAGDSTAELVAAYPAAKPFDKGIRYFLPGPGKDCTIFGFTRITDEKTEQETPGVLYEFEVVDGHLSQICGRKQFAVRHYQEVTEVKAEQAQEKIEKKAERERKEAEAEARLEREDRENEERERATIAANEKQQRERTEETEREEREIKEQREKEEAARLPG